MSVLPRLVVIYSSYDLPAINEIACHLATLTLSSPYVIVNNWHRRNQGK